MNVTDDATAVARLLSCARALRGLSLRAMAARAECSAPFLHDVENCRRAPSAATALRLAAAYRVDPLKMERAWLADRADVAKREMATAKIPTKGPCR